MNGPTLAGVTISVNDLIAPWVPIMMPVIGGIILGILELIRQSIKKRTGIVVQDAHMRVLQVALENAAGAVLNKMVERSKTIKVNTGSPAVQLGVSYVNTAAAEAVAAFGLTSEQIAEKIIAKMGVITAPNPDMNVKDETKIPPAPDPGTGG